MDMAMFDGSAEQDAAAMRLQGVQRQKEAKAKVEAKREEVQEQREQGAQRWYCFFHIVAVEEGEGEVRLVHGCSAAPSPRQRPN